MCSNDYKLHTSPHTHVQIDEHDDLESIMLLYVYGPIDYDSWTLIVIIVMTLTLPVGTAMI